MFWTSLIVLSIYKCWTEEKKKESLVKWLNWFMSNAWYNYGSSLNFNEIKTHLSIYKTFLLCPFTSHFRKCPDLVSHLGVWCFHSLLSISLLWQGGGPHWHAGEKVFLSVVIPHTAMHLTPDQPRQHLILQIINKNNRYTPKNYG